MHHVLFEIPRWLQVAVVAASAAMFVGSALAIPWLLVRVPADYFARPHAPRALGVRVLRSLVGAALVVVGVAMLVLPGQGMLTILVGVGVLDLPWKRRLVRRVLSMPTVKGAVDRMRANAGRPPLDVPPRAPAECPGRSLPRSQPRC